MVCFMLQYCERSSRKTNTSKGVFIAGKLFEIISKLFKVETIIEK